ncbi:uncharacterized protein AB675_7336 [Cyphellophora attinorum]|uniref:Uncharacterized protein n=1 Tax=Cyphellophora attinorum TaxID=1664694 RepID=A0A0N1H4L3_9EURO|nr:uncharacterized protein AB675_7336 [Phialophora attinorum]KPI36276.1 hypothetical protein AB675_7336 [Phialophora attinorum]
MATDQPIDDPIAQAVDGFQNALLRRANDERKPAGLIWVERLLAPITNVAIFGGSITFSVVIGSHDGASHFKSALPTFLALAWFFFVITLGLATAAQMALSHYEDDLREAFKPEEWTTWRNRGRAQKDAGGDDHNRGARFFCALFVNFKIGDLLCVTTLLAFVFLSLSVAAYEFAIGLLATACTGLLTVGFVITFIRQNRHLLRRAWTRLRKLFGLAS